MGLFAFAIPVMVSHKTHEVGRVGTMVIFLVNGGCCSTSCGRHETAKAGATPLYRRDRRSGCTMCWRAWS